MAVFFFFIIFANMPNEKVFIRYLLLGRIKI